MKKKLYSTGGTVKNYIQDPSEALAENDIMLAKAKQEAANDPWVVGTQMFGEIAMGVGSSMGGQYGSAIAGASKTADTGLNSFAMGGKVPGDIIEAEGNEIIETPDGNMAELKGPSHEQGGMDMFLPPGTEIFSQRLKGSDGKTMADRKKAREKELKRLEKLYKANPSDATLKKTLNKTKDTFEEQEKDDLYKMETARQAYSEVAKFVTGGITGGIPMPSGYETFEEDGYVEMDDLGMEVDSFLDSRSLEPVNTNLQARGNKIAPTASSMPMKEPDLSGVDTSKGTSGEGFSPNMTWGDGMGMAGNLISTFGQYKNTQANRAGDTPNINAYKNFGVDALGALEKSKGYNLAQREAALKDLDVKAIGAQKRNRGSARGVNTMRALDLATDMQSNQQRAAVFNAYLQQMQQIFGQEANLENIQDRFVMQGEQQRDLADRMDRDNYYTQMGKDIATMGRGMQKTGKDVNQMKTRKVTGKVLNDGYENFNFDPMTGEELTKTSKSKKSKKK